MIGERIQYLRHESRMTQKQLAKELQISVGALASYEQDTRRPSIETLVAIAKYFNVSCDFLVALSNKPIPLDEKINYKHRYIMLPESISTDVSAMKDFDTITNFLLYRYKKDV